MKNIPIVLFITAIVTACSDLKPPKITFTGNMQPINFNDMAYDNNIIIKSSQTSNGWRKRFIYSIEKSSEHSPEFFYAIAHADKIIARINPPFIDFVLAKVQSDLRNYGVTAQIELSAANDDNQDSQVILECIKYNIDRKR